MENRNPPNPNGQPPPDDALPKAQAPILHQPTPRRHWPPSQYIPPLLSDYGGGSTSGGRMGRPGYNAHEQQMFEQQKYERDQRQARQRQREYENQGVMSNPRYDPLVQQVVEQQKLEQRQARQPQSGHRDRGISTYQQQQQQYALSPQVNFNQQPTQSHDLARQYQPFGQRNASDSQGHRRSTVLQGHGVQYRYPPLMMNSPHPPQMMYATGGPGSFRVPQPEEAQASIYARCFRCRGLLPQGQIPSTCPMCGVVLRVPGQPPKVLELASRNSSCPLCEVSFSKCVRHMY